MKRHMRLILQCSNRGNDFSLSCVAISSELKCSFLEGVGKPTAYKTWEAQKVTGAGGVPLQGAHIVNSARGQEAIFSGP